MTTFEEAKAAAIRLLEPFKPDHPRVSVFVGFEVEPALWSDCPHCKTPEDALEEARREEALEKARGER